MRTSFRMLSLCFCACATLAIADPDDKSSPANATVPSSQPSASVQLHGTKVDEPTLRAKAKKLRDTAKVNPGTKETRDSELEEAEILIKLAHTKDKDLSQRRHELVEKLKKDETLPKATRFRLAGSSANIEITTNRDLSPDERMAAYAKVAWKLVEDFPDNPEGYASLLRIARDSNDAQAAEITSELIHSSTPAAIKEGALLLHERLKLTGLTLTEVASGSLPKGMPAGRLCLFTWTASRPETLAIANRLVQDLPRDTALVAICIDDDVGPARALAAEKKAPAFHIYPEGGANSSLCKKLHLGAATVYLTDANGKITTVSALQQISVQRWQKMKEAKK